MRLVVVRALAKGQEGLVQLGHAVAQEGGNLGGVEVLGRQFLRADQHLWQRRAKMCQRLRQISHHHSGITVARRAGTIHDHTLNALGHIAAKA